MKRILCILILFLIAYSCSKDDIYDNRKMMEAIINGELVIFDDIQPDGTISYQNDQACLLNITHVHGGLWTEHDTIAHLITINVPVNLGIGTHNANGLYIRRNLNFNPFNNNAGYYQNYPGTDFSLEGEVVLTSTANNRAEGTFYFTAINLNQAAERLGFKDTMVVTEGKFSIPTKFKSSCN